LMLKEELQQHQMEQAKLLQWRLFSDIKETTWQIPI